MAKSPQRRKSTSTRSRSAAKIEASKPQFQGWRTTDEEEILRRRLRAENQPFAVRALESSHLPFATYAVSSSREDSDESRAYTVEIRSLSQPLNTCSCPDHRVNGLGTCKHVEAVLLHLEADGGPKAASTGTSRQRVEIFLDRAASPPCVRLSRPPGRPSRKLEELLAPFFGADGTLIPPPSSAVPTLVRLLQGAPKRLQNRVRLSAELPPWAEEEARRETRWAARDNFLVDVQAGKRSLDVLRHPLYPYQEEGALHLAFGERALLGDEMGLGKTVQAIAACELLRRLQGIERVLVVCPVSLKGEWEDQIAKFTDLPTKVVMGSRPVRLRQYRERSFFYLTNYEQVISDGDDLQRLLAPDVIILDEAQRIKNWRTKTAQAIKRLESRHAFVLTGTPLENRIDDLYSIVQFLDPRIFGPLFRFNRDFHELDEKGRPVGYKNLPELHRRLRPVLLRRRKHEVEEQIPARTVNTYFVPMHKEQRARYAEYEGLAAQIAAIARRRPLTQKEFEKLQRYLACMRMLCDTPYILDPECRICPKLGELESLLEELLSEDGRKVLIFSEWERMLELVRELAGKMGLGLAWHTGSVPQGRRREEIRRFKKDPDCRLFLSTDSGGLGLNLQAASAVINLDLPWNPARLEQRIARAWRKHQPHVVQVVHLVTEESIEQRMLGILAGKQTLADGVLDGREGVETLPLPSGRAAFLQRLEEILEQPVARDRARPTAKTASAPEQLRQDLSAFLGERLLMLDLLSRDEADFGTALVVVDRLDDTTAPIREQTEAALRRCFAAAKGVPQLELLDRNTYETLRRLADAGVLQFATGSAGSGTEPLFRSPALVDRHAELRRRCLAAAREQLHQAEHKLRMASLLAANGFGAEALPPLAEGLDHGLLGLARLVAIEGDSALTLGARLEAHFGSLAVEGVGFLRSLEAARSESGSAATAPAEDWVGRGEALLRKIEETLDRSALGGVPSEA